MKHSQTEMLYFTFHAETPEEIAVSIVSELIKEKNSVRKTSGYDAELLDYLTGEKEPDTKKALATIVPMILPSSRTSIFVPMPLGAEPLLATIVASAFFVSGSSEKTDGGRWF